MNNISIQINFIQFVNNPTHKIISNKYLKNLLTIKILYFKILITISNLLLKQYKIVLHKT